MSRSEGRHHITDREQHRPDRSSSDLKTRRSESRRPRNSATIIQRLVKAPGIILASDMGNLVRPTRCPSPKLDPSRRPALVSMMKAPDLWYRDDRAVLDSLHNSPRIDHTQPTCLGTIAYRVWCEKAAEGGESKTRAGLSSAQIMSATSLDNTGSSASERRCTENGDKTARRAAWRGILPRHTQDLAQIRGVRDDRLSPFTPNRLKFADSGQNSHRARAQARENITALI